MVWHWKGAAQALPAHLSGRVGVERGWRAPGDTLTASPWDRRAPTPSHTSWAWQGWCPHPAPAAERGNAALLAALGSTSSFLELC